MTHALIVSWAPPQHHKIGGSLFCTRREHLVPCLADHFRLAIVILGLSHC